MCLDGHCEHNADPLATDAAGADQGAAVGRRRLLAAGLAGAGAVMLAPVSFAYAADGSSGGDATRVITGFLETGAADFVYLPVEVPEGVQKIAVSYSYDKPAVPAGTPGNSCDIGVFDERGIALGGRGFRGWSGGFRTSFEISNSDATPGYLPGPVDAGTWHVVLGPYQVAPQGMNYRVEVTLSYGEPGPAHVNKYPPLRAKGRGRDWYRGDCHLHTVYSDGKRLPSEVAAGAVPPGWTSSSPPTTTPRPRTACGASTPARTC